MTSENLSTPTTTSGCCSDTMSTGPLAIVAETKTECCSETTGLAVTNAQSQEQATSCCQNEKAAAPAAAETAELAVPEAPDDAALIDALRQVIDPELMINIVDLGLVYSINHTDDKVLVEMTLTSPACPAGPQIISQAKMSLEKLSGVSTAEIKLTMSPPWTPDRMTDDARDQLGIF